MTNVVAVTATPGSGSDIRATILSAHSVTSSTLGCFRYSRRSVRAAFFLTKVDDVLIGRQLITYITNKWKVDRSLADK